MHKLIIFVVTHGPKISNQILLDKSRKIILVGANLKSMKTQVNYYDNTGENISSLNPYYSEITALYWIWKNDRSEIIGLEHYRRFFSHKKFSLFNYKILDKNRVINYLSKSIVIVPKPVLLSESIYNNYKKLCIVDDLDTIIKYLKEVYLKDHYFIDNFFHVRNNYYPYNMFIAKREIIDCYSNWLFDIFFKSKLDIEVLKNRDSFNQRAFGYLSERLFTFYIVHNNIKIKHVKVISLEDSRSVVFRSLIELIPIRLRIKIAKIRGRVNL